LKKGKKKARVVYFAKDSQRQAAAARFVVVGIGHCTIFSLVIIWLQMK
jgi:hypothetical protein